MHNKTELRVCSITKDSRRVWTKESIKIILEGYNTKYSESIDHWEKIKELVTCGLTEANFAVLSSTSHTLRFVLEKGNWICSVRLWRTDEGQITFKVKDGNHASASVDLTYLWDLIRDTWDQG
jgi:hypothetical protein